MTSGSCPDPIDPAGISRHIAIGLTVIFVEILKRYEATTKEGRINQYRTFHIGLPQCLRLSVSVSGSRNRRR